MTTPRKLIGRDILVGMVFLVLFGVTIGSVSAQTEPNPTPPPATAPSAEPAKKTFAESAADATEKAAQATADATEKAAHSAAAATDKAIEKVAETTEKAVDATKDAIVGTGETVHTVNRPVNPPATVEDTITPWLILGGLIVLAIVIWLFYQYAYTRDGIPPGRPTNVDRR